MPRFSSWIAWLFLGTATTQQGFAAVSMVMDGVQEPQLLIDALNSPHGFALRPSDANALANADIIFYTSLQLTPWMHRISQSVAAKVPTVELLNVDGTIVLPIREGDTFESHNHQDDHQGDSEHTDEDDQNEDGHDDNSGDHESSRLADHNKDPHAWLDPKNAALWLAAIAERLSEIDPENSSTYQTNSVDAIARMNALTADITRQIITIEDPAFIVFHDSYHYFESRFDVHASASINLGDGSSPRISRLNNLQKLLAKEQVRCIFSEPQYDDRLINSIVGSLPIQVAMLDPLGSSLELGKNLYPELLNKVASNLVDCLSTNQ